MTQNSVRASEINSTTWNDLMGAFTDVTGAADVHVQIDHRRKVVHINVNGVCLTRICQIQNLHVEELRP